MLDVDDNFVFQQNSSPVHLASLTAYALESRVGWAPARKERTNETHPSYDKHSPC